MTQLALCCPVATRMVLSAYRRSNTRAESSSPRDPDSARFPSMPRYAIETGNVDRVLSPGEIAGRAGTSEPAVLTWSDATTGMPSPTTNEALLKRIFHRIRSAHGLDFTRYKRSTLGRRLDRRMTLRGIESLE